MLRERSKANPNAGRCIPESCIVIWYNISAVVVSFVVNHSLIGASLWLMVDAQQSRFRRGFWRRKTGSYLKWEFNLLKPTLPCVSSKQLAKLLKDNIDLD